MIAILAHYEGMTMCDFTEWKDQEKCDYSIKSAQRESCFFMRTDELLYGTCSEPNVCADKVNN